MPPSDMSELEEATEDKPVKKASAKKAAKKSAKKAAKKTAKKAAKKTVAKKAAKKAAKKSAKKAAKKVAKAKDDQAELSLDDAVVKAPPEVEPETKSEAEPVVKAAPEVEDKPKARAKKTPKKAQEAEEAPKQDEVEGGKKFGRVKGGGRVERPAKKEQDSSQESRKSDDSEGEREEQDDRRGGRNNRRGRNNRGDRKPREVVLEGPELDCYGMLELAPKGFGFVRLPEKDFEQDKKDVFVTPDTVRKYGLRQGVFLKGTYRIGPKGPQMTELEEINGNPPEKMKKLPHFEELKAVNPTRRISFETTSERATTRVMDVVAPIGRGQRGLIVSPPRSGKTTLLLHTAEALIEKYEEQIHLIVLLVDERPEEVTEFRRSLPDTEIYASSNDMGARNHTRMAELCIERAKRLVEEGKDVFILMDSITRLARAYNNAQGGNKKSKGRGYQSGGIVAGALEMPRRIFAAARDTKTAGSLTILATALVQTNSKADELIFQEFKGTGNMELVLDRRVAEQYLYPAVDIFKSGTRREELLMPEHLLHKIHLIRRGLAGHKPAEAIERLLYFIKKFPNNNQMLLEIKG